MLPRPPEPVVTTPAGTETWTIQVPAIDHRGTCLL